ncbi:MAG: cytochrome c-type biogenesis protein CcmH [Nevskiaceae bacterium]|nr:MAG: cytochrome c-type biogenesis protein CcmH [Nevskiaceae bacterium]TAM25524.1 MAG: cytochrome c-type biogenesis protein CcmH [Nevskiaceae bacterium]
MRRNYLAALLLLLSSVVLADVDGLDAQQEARYQALIAELRCLVCQNQTIAESNAPLAVDLRNQVKTQIVAGRSQAEIVGYLTERYGDFVLYRPPFKASTALLWLGPFLLLLGGLVWALRYVRGTRRPAAATEKPVDPEAVQRLLAETQAALAAQDAPARNPKE